LHRRRHRPRKRCLGRGNVEGGSGVDRCLGVSWMRVAGS
jgi:hypothetical protein